MGIYTYATLPVFHYKKNTIKCASPSQNISSSLSTLVLCVKFKTQKLQSDSNLVTMTLFYQLTSFQVADLL